jgi:hypothetical protein
MSESVELQPVKVYGWYQGTTNIRKFSVIYSIKNRKFVKGFFDGSRTSGNIIYRLYPGKYLRFEYKMWTKADPPRAISIKLINISAEKKGDEAVAREEVIASTTIKFYTDDFIKELNIPQLIDFFEGRPGYHSKPYINTDRIYGEGEHAKLLEFIDVNNGKEIIEGEEHE